LRSPAAAASVKDHFLTSYQAALAAVLGVQFSSKRFASGPDGVLRLAQRAGEGRQVPWRPTFLEGMEDFAMYQAMALHVSRLPAC
jgi:hypothetical protein